MDTPCSTQVLFAPVHFKDVGIGGGENIAIWDDQGNGGMISMVGHTNKIRLIYEETEICETLGYISSDVRYICLNDKLYLNKGCKIIIETYISKPLKNS